MRRPSAFFFFFNDTATTEIYTLSLHDALPISHHVHHLGDRRVHLPGHDARARLDRGDRKSTRLNSSHSQISYAVFCLKKKKRADARSQSLPTLPLPTIPSGRTRSWPARHHRCT